MREIRGRRADIHTTKDGEFHLEPVPPDSGRRVSEEWDRRVLDSPEGSVHHTWGWYDVLRDGLGEMPLRWWVRRKGDVIGVLSAARRGVRAGRSGGRVLGRFLYRCWSPSPRVWGYGGPCLGPSEDAAMRLAVVRETAVLLGRQVGCMGSRFALQDSDGSLSGCAESLGARAQIWPTGFLRLQVPERDLYAGLTRGLRYNIHRAEKASMEVREARSEADLRDFLAGPWQTLQERLRGESPSPYSPVYLGYAYFRALQTYLVPSGQCLILLAHREGQVVAGTVTTHFGSMAFLEHTATGPGEQGLSPGSLLLWDAIKRLRSAGVEYLDLGGIPEDARNGVGNFKRSWGPQASRMTWLYFPARTKARP